MKLTDLGLNEEKIRAATHNGNVFVVGNPGTGKTKLIVGRVLHLLENGVKPEQILCMTFTIKATDELRERLVDDLSKAHPEVSRVSVETFHSFSYNSVKPYLQQKGIKEKVLKEGMQRFLLYNAIKSLDIFDYSDEYLFQVVRTLSSKLSYIKAFGKPEKHDADRALKNLAKVVDPNKLEAQEKKIRDFIPFIPKIIEEYDKEKKKHGIDYTDMLLYFSEYLDTSPMHFEHVIVDELQDANELQSDIVFKLSEKGMRFAVGDRKQSIFRFQGASVNSFNRFEKNAKKFILSENFRSTNEILGYAKGYLMKQTERYEDELKDLASDRKGPKPIVINAEKDSSIVIHKIDEMLERNEEVAVIAKTNAQLQDVALALDCLGKPYSISGSSNATSDYMKNSIMDMINVLLNGNMDSFVRVLASPFINVSFKDVVEIKDYIKKNKITDIEKLRKTPALSGFFIMKDRFNRDHANMYKSFGILFSQYLLPTALSLGRDQFLTVNGIYGSVRDFFEDAVVSDYSDIMGYIDISSEIFEMLVGQEESRIRLLTVHAAKGKEFEAVIYLPTDTRSSIQFIEWAFDGLIMEKCDIAEDLAFEDFKVDFVAMTRGKKELMVMNYKNRYHIDGVSENITAAKTDKLEIVDAKANSLFNRYSDLLPLLQECKYNEAVKKIEEMKEKRPFPLDWLFSYIDEKRKTRTKYSYTYISPFLECHRRFLLENILDISAFEETTGAMDFGIEVHDILEKAVAEGKTSFGYIKDENIRQAVENAQKCEEKLLDKLKSKSAEVKGIELDLAVPLSEFLGKKCEGIIYGKLDKVLLVGDKTVIVDYKTGRSQRSEPLQLHLYKYLFEKNNPSVSSENVLPYFYYVNVRDNPVKGPGNKAGYEIASVALRQYGEKMGELKETVDEIAFGEPKLFLEKNDKSCERCSMKLMCDRLDYEMKS